MAETNTGEQARELLVGGLGRRDFLRAAAVVGTAGVAAPMIAGGGAEAAAAAPVAAPAATYPREILQSGKGPILGQHYLRSTPDEVRWGYVPALDSAPVLRMR